MESIVAALLTPGQGILAADESIPTIEKRFAALHLVSTAESRRAYRELLFMTPGLNDFISGAILFDETMRQTSASGTPLPEILARHGIITGVKVDAGTIALPGFPGEKITQGLDGLHERLAAYRTLGARFTKWRAVIAIGDHLPTAGAIRANAHALARFAALSQEAGLVPIVEPEVLLEGNHTLARCEEVMAETMQTVFATLIEQRVELKTMLLKASMVLPGKECLRREDLATVAAATIHCLRRTVPAAVPGIVFLSGGQSDVAATECLDAICRTRDVQWQLSFSFGRALQDAAMKTWHGLPANVAKAQAALLHRARCNGLAVQGKYTVEAESAAA